MPSAPENTYLLHKWKYPCAADLLFVWFVFDQTSIYVCCYFNISKAAESKKIKQDVSLTVILSPYIVSEYSLL